MMMMQQIINPTRHQSGYFRFDFDQLVREERSQHQSCFGFPLPISGNYRMLADLGSLVRQTQHQLIGGHAFAVSIAVARFNFGGHGVDMLNVIVDESDELSGRGVGVHWPPRESLWLTLLDRNGLPFKSNKLAEPFTDDGDDSAGSVEKPRFAWAFRLDNITDSPEYLVDVNGQVCFVLSVVRD